MKFLELKVPPVAVFLICVVGIGLARKLAPQLSFAVPFQKLLGLLLACLGIAVGAAGVLAFRRARTTVDPRFPERAAAIVNTGVFAWSRNPMYLGLVCMLFGWAVVAGNGLGFAFVVLFVAYMNRFQIRPEERALTASFGEEYTRYRASVRRWI